MRLSLCIHRSFQSSSKAVIPKRGDKEFEPAPGGGSSLQAFSLERSRQAMTDALRGTRTIASKSISYGIWLPHFSRVQVFQTRGVLFNTLGHPMRRSVVVAPNEKPKTVTTLELLPEEALYVIERGSLLCFNPRRPLAPEAIQQLEPESSSFAEEPLTVQQAFAEMIGKESLTLARYQCYSCLKRLGFIVTRAVPPPSSPSYPVPPPHKVSNTDLPSVFVRLLNWFTSFFQLGPRSIIRGSILGIRTSGLRSFCDYTQIFRALRIIPSGHSHPIGFSSSSQEHSEPESPYTVFYHVWKPNTPWKKTAPPKADFELVVIDGRTTPMPSLHELTSLFATLPRTAPPLPKKRLLPTTPNTSLTDSKRTVSAPSPTTSLRAFSTWLFGINRKATGSWTQPKPNPFASIRAGNKNVILGVVDAGNVSFFRFGEGCFDEWPMI
ncbi:hypothetical protein DL93DRAFT_2061606 [Clavulina sp. PMI_390]|nr:hypothetical protein DL93DRAFT_2061606 [Clavulina sp. PMI_390]